MGVCGKMLCRVERDLSSAGEEVGHDIPRNAKQRKPPCLNEEPAIVFNQVAISSEGPVHIGNTYNIDLGQVLTQINKYSNTNVYEKGQQARNDNQEEISKKKEKVYNNGEVPSKDFVRPLWFSKSLLENDSVLLELSHCIGENWREVVL